MLINVSSFSAALSSFYSFELAVLRAPPPKREARSIYYICYIVNRRLQSGTKK